MAITIKCPDCGHTKQSDDGDEETCPECEGTMAPPKKKKYQAKSSTLEDEERAKTKSKRRDDEDDERPKKKAKPREDDEDDDRPAKKKAGGKSKAALDFDEGEDDEKGGGSTRDGKAAEALDLNPGFKNRALMKQVEKELSRGEVLHFACRPCEKIAKMQGFVGSAFGAVFAVIGVIVLIVFATGVAKGIPVFAYAIPVAFILIGGLIAILAPIAKIRQAKRGWYAVTDRRAIVFTASLWGESGQTEVYPPSALRRMWIKKSFWVKGAGDLVFKTETTHHTRTEYDSRGRGRTSTSTSTQHFGFLGVEDVKDIETLVHEVLLAGRRSRDEDDDEDDE